MTEKTEKHEAIALAKIKKTKGIKGLLITGLIFILPLYITWILIKLVIEWLKDLLHDTFSILFKLVFGSFLGEYYAKIEWIFLFMIGLPIVGLFLIVVGWAAQNLFGKKILSWAEENVKKIPIIGGIYSSSRQLVDTVFVKGKESYKKVVMVEYPRKGCRVIGFVTGETSDQINPQKENGEKNENDILINVFIPTTPNPTSGFLCFFRKSDVIPLNISVEEGLKLIISGGILAPEKKENEK